jgi:hypothetical protein
MEIYGHLPSLDTDVCSTPDGSPRHTVYRKSGCTNLHLNGRSQHHPVNKQAAISPEYLPVQWL